MSKKELNAVCLESYMRTIFLGDDLDLDVMRHRH